MLKKPTLWILALIMLVNALSYGTIIPLLYPYAARFGLNPLWLSFLFTSYSLFQFLATPVMGRLSDKFGRKPLLLVSLGGTSLSLAIFAMATSVPMLFFARILDGITGGNISVAQAVIADTTDGPERAKMMGMLGAAFGFGFLVGPALGGLLSQFGLTAPFWFAAALALVGTVLAAVLLPETLSSRSRSMASNEPLFNVFALISALSTPVIGTILLVTFLSSIAQNSFVIGFQAFSVDVLNLSSTNIGLQFALYGLIGIVMQAVGIGWLLNKFPAKRQVLQGSLLLSAGAMVFLALQRSYAFFTIANVSYAFVSAPIFVLLAGIISERTKAEDQGATLGINQSYMSLGQIIGPLLAGAVSTLNVSAIFVLAMIFYLISWWAAANTKARAALVDV